MREAVGRAASKPVRTLANSPPIPRQASVPLPVRVCINFQHMEAPPLRNIILVPARGGPSAAPAYRSGIPVFPKPFTHLFFPWKKPQKKR